MVNFYWTNIILVAESAKDTVLEKLDPERRAAIVLALVGLALLGVLLVVITMLAGRWARHNRPLRSTRLGNGTQTSSHQGHDLENGNVRRDETIASDPGSEDTKA